MPKRGELGEVGGHLVCAELFRNNMIAELTHKNAPEVDVLVYDPKENRSAAIQVKTANDVGDKTTFQVGNKSPRQMLAGFNPRNPYMFVLEMRKSARFFVVPAKKVREAWEKEWEIYKNKNHPRSSIDVQIDRSAPQRIRAELFREFEDKWEFIWSSS